MRDQPTSELAECANAHSLQRMVSGQGQTYKTILADPPWIYTYDTRKTEVAGTGWRGAGERPTVNSTNQVGIIMNTYCSYCCVWGDHRAPECEKLDAVLNPKKTSWISVSDRLPDYDQWVLMWLVTNNPEHSGTVIGQRSWHEAGMFWGDNMMRPMAWISHWMPLPDPPPKPWGRITTELNFAVNQNQK